MRARLRGPGGASTITLPDEATVGDLLAEITQKTSIAKFDIKYGYPPKPLLLGQSPRSKLLKDLDVKLDGEQLTISAKEDEAVESVASKHNQQTSPGQGVQMDVDGSGGSFSFGSISTTSTTPSKSKSKSKSKSSKPIALQKKSMMSEVPEIPMPERSSTLVLRVMPDDNSCLFRAFGTAVLPGDDQSMPELRSLVASAIQSEPETYSRVVLDQNPDDYCRWIQTPDAWGGAIEMGILSKHFGIEICSIDVKSLRVDKFNSGAATRCILLYSGIHYDTIVQSPSEAPYTKADNPPEFDVRVWDADDEEILVRAGELAQKLQALHYYTDTGGMSIRCESCGTVVYGEAQASSHAEQTGHYDMVEVI